MPMSDLELVCLEIELSLGNQHYAEGPPSVNYMKMIYIVESNLDDFIVVLGNTTRRNVPLPTASL